MQRENHLEATLEEYRYLCERLNQYENVSVFFFPAEKDIICDLNHYADYSHYHPRYNRYMAECFANGNNLVAKEFADGKHIDAFLEEMREIVEQYDFDSLHEKLKQYE